MGNSKQVTWPSPTLSSMSLGDFINYFSFINISDSVSNSNLTYNLYLNVTLEPELRDTYEFKEVKVEYLFDTINRRSNSLDIYGLNSNILKMTSLFICESLGFFV